MLVCQAANFLQRSISQNLRYLCQIFVIELLMTKWINQNFLESESIWSSLPWCSCPKSRLTSYQRFEILNVNVRFISRTILYISLIYALGNVVVAVTAIPKLLEAVKLWVASIWVFLLMPSSHAGRTSLTHYPMFYTVTIVGCCHVVYDKVMFPLPFAIS